MLNARYLRALAAEYCQRGHLERMYDHQTLCPMLAAGDLSQDAVLDFFTSRHPRRTE